MTNELKQAFAEVKPYCVEVSKRRDVKSIQQLNAFLKSITSSALQELHEYVLFPLRVVFLQGPKVKEDVIVAAADCMHFVFQKVHVREWKTFQDLFNILLMQITSADSEKICCAGSEEKKLSILTAVVSLLTSSLFKHWKMFYDVNNIPSVGHLVSLCLSTISTEMNKYLRKTAITVIEVLCTQVSTVEVKDDRLPRFLVGNCMSSLLPGILGVLVKVVSGDVKQGGAVKEKAIDTIALLLSTSASDLELELQSDPVVKDYCSDAVISAQLRGFLVKRDRDWVKEVSNKMAVVLDHVITASDHSSARVRMSVLGFSHTMLLHCHKNLFKESIGKLLQIPCQLLSDDVEEVASKCGEVIDDFSDRCRSVADVREIIQEELFKLCNGLSRVISKSSDLNKLTHLKLVFGFLQVLKYNLQSFCYSSVHVTDLIKSLLFCFQMDCSNLHKIEEVTSTALDFDSAIASFFKGQSRNWLFRKSFAHFHDEQISSTLVKICRLLGKYGDLDVMLDSLKSFYESETLCRPTVLLISEILLGTSDSSRSLPNIYEHIDGLIDLYIANENWYLCTSSDSLYLSTHHAQKIRSRNSSLVLTTSSDVNDVTLKTINANVILVCLQIESLAAFSLVLQKDFRKTLIKTLYPLLEKVNDENHLISSCALQALSAVASSCQYKTIADLISQNADYLVSTISVHLRHLNLFPRSPAVLRAMMTHCDEKVFPLVRDTIDEILIAMDMHRRDHRYFFAFLPVMMSTVKAINDWFVKTDVESLDNQIGGKDNEEPSKDQSDSALSITESLVDYYKNFKLSTLQEQPDTDETNPNQPFGTEKQGVSDPDLEQNFNDAEFLSEEKKDIESHVKVVEQIVQRCSHLLTSKEPKVRLAVMEIITEGVICLRVEENVFLPLVHKLWKPLTSRCADPEMQVIAKAFGVICFIGRHCGTFIRRRFTEDVLPKVIAFLKEHSKSKYSSSVVHSQTTLFKLQLTMLREIGPLLLSVTMSFKDTFAICDSCRNYLRSSQPLQLQRAAIFLFQHLIKLDSDAVWLFLRDTWSSNSTLAPPHQLFNRASVAGTNDETSEFAANVRLLLERC